MRYHKDERYNRKIKKFFKTYAKGNIPERCPEILRDQYSLFRKGKLREYRWMYVKNISYVMLTKNWMRYLVKFLKGKKCLEIMAGSGWFSNVLRSSGIDSHATDNFSWGYKAKYDVEKIDCHKAIVKYGKDVDYIICTWPYMDNDVAYALLYMREVNPNCRMIYIGEGPGGCTADDDFFDIAIEDDLNSEYLISRAVDNYRTWDGIYDNLIIYK